MTWIKRIVVTLAVLVTASMAVSPVYLYLNPAIRGRDVFWTSDQQAQRLFDQGRYGEAALRFTDPLRRGLSLYAAEDFSGAQGQFVQIETAQGFFNLGNTYCHLERIPEAIDAYRQALSLEPDDADTQFNLVFAQLLLPPKRPDDAPDAEPSFDADDIRFDNTENKGTSGEVELTQLSDDQIADLWMRRVQTTPADFLRVKFSYDVHAQDDE